MQRANSRSMDWPYHQGLRRQAVGKGGPDELAGTAIGSLVGALVGVLGGPAGILVGMTAGMMLGASATFSTSASARIC